MIKRLIGSVVVVYLYWIHVPTLRLLGPRAAILLSRAFAFVQWLLVVCGLNIGNERTALRRLKEVLPLIRPGTSPRLTLLRNIALKHRVFVEYATFTTARGRRYVEKTYRFEGREHLDAAVQTGTGAILVTFHFGMTWNLFPALKMLGYDVLFHFARINTYVHSMYEWARRIVLKAHVALDRCQGPVLYHYPNLVFPMLVRRLRRGKLAAMLGDGMGSTEFADVPWLGGISRLPTGPARLSALTGAPMLCMFILPEGLNQHRIIVHPPFHCAQGTAEAVQQTIARYTALLSDYVRADPWAFLRWRHLAVTRQEHGPLRLDIVPMLPAQATAAYDFIRRAGQARTATAASGAAESTLPEN
jgi:lauroyl/myristoyl acyltransferase